MSERFKSASQISVGDLVLLPHPTWGRDVVIQVTKIFDGYVDGFRVESGSEINTCYYTHFKPYENNDQTIMSKEQLFTWTDKEGYQCYGTYLATNSSGQYVIEEKQTGDIVTMSTDEVEEVLPWTFSAKNGSTEEHFTGPDTIKKGDSLIQILTSKTPRVWFVTDVDTKNRSATKFVGRRIVTEEI